MKRITALLVLAALFTLVGCSNKKISSIEVGRNIKSSERLLGKMEDILNDNVKTAMRTMTLEEKIGQMFIIGFDGTKANDSIKEMIQQNHIGGVILFSRNIEDGNQLSDLINSLKKVNEINTLPLFISIDEEGGRVSRLPQEAKKFPSNKVIGTKNSKELSFKIGQDIGSELRSFGINMDFAPVLDIYSNPKNTVIGDRSYGNNPKVVGSLGVAAMKGLQSKNIISVIKHFPGHGDTEVDSHFGLPVVYYDKSRLDNFELVPFKEAVKNGADVIMAAHIEFPNIDKSKKPATLSKKILTDILRTEMGFKGVIITDDMEMGAIANNFGIKESIVETVTAGTDIILMGHDTEKQKEAFNILKQAVEKGDISIERINQSVERILRLKQKYLDSI